jgi:hypothetical protein
LDRDHALIGGKKRAVEVVGRIRMQGVNNVANSARGGVVDTRYQQPVQDQAKGHARERQRDQDDPC